MTMKPLENGIYKFLKADPIPWLLEKSDPCMRYLTNRDIIGIDHDTNDYFEFIHQSPLSSLCHDHVIGDMNHYDVYPRGSFWHFAEAVEKGGDIRLKSIKTTAYILIEKMQTPSGGFAINHRPRVPLGCRTGDCIRLLLKSGIHDEKIARGVEWICSHQRHDGGWLHCPVATRADQLSFILFNGTGNGLSRETGNAPSCIYATASCAMALIEYARTNGTTSHIHDAILKAAHFLLSLKLGMTESVPHACYFNPQKADFSLLGYPVIAQYDILFGSLLTARTSLRNDPRAVEPFNCIISKQSDNGRWMMENCRQGMLPQGTGRKKYPSKWVTLNALRLLKEISQDG